MSKNQVSVVVRDVGSQSNLAAMLDVQPPAITQWLEAGYFPAGRAIQIERLTKGKFKATDLAAGDARTKGQLIRDRYKNAPPSS